MIFLFIIGRMCGKSGKRVFGTRCEVMRSETPEWKANPFKAMAKVVSVTDKEIVQNIGLDAMVSKEAR